MKVRIFKDGVGRIVETNAPMPHMRVAVFGNVGHADDLRYLPSLDEAMGRVESPPRSGDGYEEYSRAVKGDDGIWQYEFVREDVAP
jgi:hypothetical protein